MKQFEKTSVFIGLRIKIELKSNLDISRSHLDAREEAFAALNATGSPS